MGRPHVWTTRPCQVCGTEFRKKPSNPKKHCSSECIRVTAARHAASLMAGTNQSGSNNPNWKGEEASRWAMHKRANALKGPGQCERCPGPGEVVHHKDENPRNNSLDNLERLCRACHASHHGRQRGGLNPRAGA